MTVSTLEYELGRHPGPPELQRVEVDPITMFPNRSTWASTPGGITVVESYWLTIAGPTRRFPAFSASRSK